MPKNIRETEWIENVLQHLSSLSVGGSTLRSQCAEGGVMSARNFLRQLSISDLSRMDQTQFARFLQQQTTNLSRKILHPQTGKPNFGAARKVINIFLRTCAMNKDIYKKFNLKKIEPFLEVPIDRQVVNKINAIKIENGYRFNLPTAQPFTIRDLDSTNHRLFQNAASQIAADMGLYRYELDIIFWRVED